MSAVIGSYRARSRLDRFALVWYCADYATAVFKQSGMVYSGGTVYYIRYTIFTSLSIRYPTLVFTRAR